jgi:hypothetical protein
MTMAPSHPPVHSYDPGKDPMELVTTTNGPMERWRADALLLGETSAAIQARHDAVTSLDELAEQKRELAASQATLAIERATFDAEKRAFADQAATLAGRLSVEWDRIEKMRADKEPIASPPGDPSDPSKLPEPSLELEDQVPPEHGDPPGDPSGEEPSQTEFPDPELPEPPVVAQPIAAGLDEDKT